MRILIALAAWMMLLAGSAEAATEVIAEIDISDQRMRVVVDGQEQHVWKVSTAAPGYRTPVGTYKPTRMHERYFSVKYDGAPMPHSVFFHRGYAIHGTTEIKRLGQPASHGCVRLHPDHARELFALIRKAGADRTRITVVR